MLRFERDVEEPGDDACLLYPVTWEIKAGRSEVQAQSWLGGQPKLYGYSSHMSIWLI